MSEKKKPPRNVTLRTGTGNELLDYSIKIGPDGTKRITAEGREDHERAMAVWEAMKPSWLSQQEVSNALPVSTIDDCAPDLHATASRHQHRLEERVALFLEQFSQKQRAAANILDTTHTLRLFVGIVGIVGDKYLPDIGPEDMDLLLDDLVHWPPNATLEALKLGSRIYNSRLGVFYKLTAISTFQ
jgi:hypothetical protein